LKQPKHGGFRLSVSQNQRWISGRHALLAATRSSDKDGVMDLTHRFSVPAPVDQAWNAFNDLEGLAACFPGATITGVDGDEFTGSVKIKMGPISLMYNGSGRYVERNDADRRVVIEARGEDKRGNGTARATVTALFAQSGEQTDVEVLTDLAITGKPAQFGHGVISDASDKLLDQFASCVSERFTDGLGAAASERASSFTGPISDEADTEQTIELEAVPAEEVPAEEVPAEEVTATAAAAVQAESVSAPPSSGQPAYAAQALDDGGESTLSVLSTVVPVVLRRYGPLLAIVGLLIFILIKIVRRKS
jgi:carbon monoxide dehydrogenase subunit G